jgi:hypothetical protein
MIFGFMQEDPNDGVSEEFLGRGGEELPGG